MDASGLSRVLYFYNSPIRTGDCVIRARSPDIPTFVHHCPDSRNDARARSTGRSCLVTMPGLIIDLGRADRSAADGQTWN
jgi:hypothetical protein